MSSRSRVTTIATLALLFMALVFGARGISRELAAPFEGLEQFAMSRGAVASIPEDEFQEPLRHIDWDAPATAAPAPRATTRPTAMLALSLALRLESGESLVVGSTRQFAEISYRFIGEPDLESLTTQLNLNESQKAMVTALLDWRKWSLDTLAQLNGDEDSKERINGSFREAVESLLDPAQAEKYKGMQSPRNWIALRPLSSTVFEYPESTSVRNFIKRVVSEKK